MTSSITKISFHNLFLSSSEETEFCVDHKKLTSSEEDIIYEWIEHILGSIDLHGKNKESWVLGKEAMEIGAAAALYKDSNAWHYHCGPTQWKAGTALTPPHLPRNLVGRATKENIHYFKVSDDEIVIFGYSKKHIPFLNKENLPPGHSFFDRTADPTNASPYDPDTSETEDSTLAEPDLQTFEENSEIVASSASDRSDDPLGSSN